MGSTFTSLMDNSQSQSEVTEEMSLERKISQALKTDGNSSFDHQTLRQGGGGSAFPRQRLVLLSLGLLNAVLLIAAVVIGIYCANVPDLQIPSSAAMPIIIEMNYLRNQSNIIRAKVEAETALMKERGSHTQLKLQVRQQKILTDSFQGQIEKLHAEQAYLQTNMTALEENCGRCRPGWNFLKTSCYYFSSHHESNSKKNWFDSRAHCISQGGDLLVINSLEEQTLISDNFPRQISGIMWWERGVWIGLNDAATAGTWVWVNNVTEVETVYWKTGQPNHSGAQSGHCAAFYYTDTMKTWYNGNCDNHLYYWICEMGPSLTRQLAI